MNWVAFESSAYWITFTVAFLAVAQWESLAAHRSAIVDTRQRWSRHGALLLVGMVLRSPILRLTPVAVAFAARENPLGIFRSDYFQERTGYWVALLTTLLMLDFLRYATHRLFHAFEWLWRIHRVHHSDPDFDVSTGVRFHPLEGLLVQVVTLAAIWVLAPPVAGVILSELLVVGVNFFQHANANLPASWERRLRLWLVTPGLHRIHHSQHIADHGTNLGELFPWWDRMMGTYTDKSAGGNSFEVGLPGYQNTRSVELGEMLIQPMRGIAEPSSPKRENADVTMSDTGISR